MRTYLGDSTLDDVSLCPARQFRENFGSPASPESRWRRRSPDTPNPLPPAATPPPAADNAGRAEEDHRNVSVPSRRPRRTPKSRRETKRLSRTGTPRLRRSSEEPAKANGYPAATQ